MPFEEETYTHENRPDEVTLAEFILGISLYTVSTKVLESGFKPLRPKDALHGAEFGVQSRLYVFGAQVHLRLIHKLFLEV